MPIKETALKEFQFDLFLLISIENKLQLYKLTFLLCGLVEDLPAYVGQWQHEQLSKKGCWCHADVVGASHHGLG